jgi:hypothetical protein
MPPHKSEFTVAPFPIPIIKFGIVPAGPSTSRMWTLTQWTLRARSGCCQRIHSPSLRRCAQPQAHVPCISIPVLLCLAVLRMLQHTPWPALSIHPHSQLAQQGQHCRAVKCLSVLLSCVAGVRFPQPKREPRPKKPRLERPASERPAYEEFEDDDEDEDPLAFQDDAADEDFDLAAEVRPEVCTVSAQERCGCVSHSAGNLRPVQVLVAFVAPPQMAWFWSRAAVMQECLKLIAALCGPAQQSHAILCTYSTSNTSSSHAWCCTCGYPAGQ